MSFFYKWCCNCYCASPRGNTAGSIEWATALKCTRVFTSRWKSVHPEHKRKSGFHVTLWGLSHRRIITLGIYLQMKATDMWKLFSHLESVYHKALKKQLDSSSANSTFVVSWWGRTLVAACLMSRVATQSTARRQPRPLWCHAARWACHRPEMTENARMRWHVIVHLW